MMIVMRIRIKTLCFIFAFFLLSALFTKQASAITFDQIKETTVVSLTQVLEKIELTFTFKEESRIKVLGKHAERRIEWAEESFNNGATQKAQNYLNEYVQVKKEVSAKLDQVDEKIVNDFKNRTIVENRKIDEFKNDISETSRVIVEETQTEVLEKTWEVVGNIQGEEAAENFVKTIYAPGTGPGGESQVVIEGGELKFAPGTESGGENKMIESTVEIKTEEHGSGNSPQTSSGKNKTVVTED